MAAFSNQARKIDMGQMVFRVPWSVSWLLHSLTREHPYGTRDTTESHSIIRSINHLYLKMYSSTRYTIAALDLLGNELFRKKEEIADSDLSS